MGVDFPSAGFLGTIIAMEKVKEYGWIIAATAVSLVALILVLVGCAFGGRIPQPAGTMPTETIKGGTPEIDTPEGDRVTPMPTDIPTAEPESSLTTQSLTGTWRLAAYKNLITGEIEFEPKGINRSIIIEFQDNGKEGKLKGQTVTNNVNGEYEILENNKIKIIRFGGTKIAEPSWGDKFWKVIYLSSSYEVSNDLLLLYFNNDKELMEFVGK